MLRTALRSPSLWIALTSVILALCFLGTRGMWDPDEGRYTNVALNMLLSGDWLNPHRNHEVGHWTKPPLTYWAIATSIAVFGANTWAARLPAALSYLLCVWLTGRIARRLSPASEHFAMLVYATMCFTVGASQLITTDYVLAACEALAMWAFVEARFGKGPHPRRWVALMWVGFALAFVTKGPAGLVPLPVVLLFDYLMPGRRMHRVLQWSGIIMFAVLALPWYLAVFHGNPGLFRYFVGDELVNRVTTDEFGRHGEWYGWLEIYLPTVVLGTLPWTPALWRWARALPASVRRWRGGAEHRQADAHWLLLGLWLLLPLLVFCVARSRMPLYVLPLFVPMALIVALQWQREDRPLPRWRWLLAWVAMLLALKLALAWWPTHKDARAWADAIRERARVPVQEVVFVEDMARYGLHLHLGTGTEVEKISLVALQQPRFNPAYDEPLAVELDEHESGVVWVCKQQDWPLVLARIAGLGYRATLLGTPYRHRVMFEVHPDDAAGQRTAPANAR
ncbi:glycosyltransferase family 39 protein [Lysobacter sp. S4-A87]|uniref:ArnT family glycosyltransferase n=1 Tax=Lysobacter sp. S4-A87 TaxID=2925843 RepID=UPI001F53A4C4|nr:glycosyltransferase family 39 protein [Lysobacter sp. S4-A87]UNK48343.1 glycosyltransferase family 39 protein [Lysobacter sp. S4-A87]